LAPRKPEPFLNKTLTMVAITSNKLVIGVPQNATRTGTYDAGCGVTGQSIASGDIMKFEVDLTFDITTGSGEFGPMGAITFGDYNGSYNTYPHDSSKFTAIGLRRSGSNMRFEPVNGSDFEVTYGDTNTLTLFMNDTGVAQSYVGPDGGTYNLSVSNQVDVNTDPYVQGSYAIWIGNSIMGDDLVAPTFTHATNGHTASAILDTVMMYANSDGDVGIESTFDNFAISSIPEPSTIAMVMISLAAAAIGLRRRKS
jgi:hypothetical protein